jgi:hypothetical protein
MSVTKAILLATVAASLFAIAPASAQTKHRALRQPAPVAGDIYFGNAVRDPYAVTDGAEYIGRDRDPQVRGLLLKDDSAHNGNQY